MATWHVRGTRTRPYSWTESRCIFCLQIKGHKVGPDKVSKIHFERGHFRLGEFHKYLSGSGKISGALERHFLAIYFIDGITFEYNEVKLSKLEENLLFMVENIITNIKTCKYNFKTIKNLKCIEILKNFELITLTPVTKAL